MKTLLRCTLFALALLVLVAPAAAQDSLPLFKPSPCLFTPSPGQPVECGTLFVPEDRSDPNSPTIRLPVAIFKAQTPNPLPDPIIYLDGGPGGVTIANLPDNFTYSFSGFLGSNRDFIMFDQRGVGFAQPSLECPEYTQATLDILDDNLSDVELTLRINSALRACRARLASAGADLTNFNSAESAADVNDLRIALGYDTVNLLGISYGTRLALTIMRDFPEHIRSVVLDSVYPPQIDSEAEGVAVYDRVFQTLFAGCAASPSCDAAFPNLKDTLVSTARQLNANPVMSSITIASTGETYDLLINGDTLIYGLYFTFYITDFIPEIPQMIYDAALGNFDTLSYLFGFFLDDTLTEGVYYSVTCQEEFPFTTLDAVISAAAAHPDLAEFYTTEGFAGERDAFDLCREFYPDSGDPVENQPVVSDIPTLVMSAEYDPVTPPAWAEDTARSLSNSYYFEYPGLGHGVTPAHACPLQMAVNFFIDPAQTPDSACMAQMGAPQFVVPFNLGMVTLAPFKDAALGIMSVVPEGWQQVEPGVFAFDPNLPTRLAFRVPEDGISGYMQRIVIESYGYSQLPDPTETVDANGMAWTIYPVEGQGVYTYFAVTEQNGTGYVVAAVGASPEERSYLYNAVLLPAIQAFKAG